MTASAAPAAPERRRDLWLVLALTLAVGALSPWFPALRSGNELSRLFLTEAVLVDGTLHIDGPCARYGPAKDRSAFGGHLWTDKAPGSSLAALPFVAVYRALAPAPDLPGMVRAARLGTSVLPTFFLLWGLLGWLRERADAHTARAVTAAVALGSLATPYGTLLFGHALASALTLHAWLAARRLRRDHLGDGVILGLLGGLAVFCEYPTLPLLVPAAVLGAVRAGFGRALGGAFLGLALPAGLLAAYHTHAFGHPLQTGYRYIVNPFLGGLHRQGLFGLVWPPRLERLGFHLISPRKGLFFFAPWLALSVPGVVAAWQGRRAAPFGRADLAHALWVMAGSLLLLLMLTFDNGGWTLGQRHLTVAVPGLAWLVALALVRWPGLRAPFVGLALVAGGLSSLGTAVFPYFPEYARHPSLQYTWAFARAGVEGGSLWSLVGVPSVWGAALVLAVFAGLGLRWLRRPAPILVALALAAGGLTGLALLRRDAAADPRRDALLQRLKAEEVGAAEAP